MNHTDHRIPYEDGNPVPTNEVHLGDDNGQRVEWVLQNFPESAPNEEEATKMIEAFEDLLGIANLRRMALGAGGHRFQADPLKVKLLDIITLALEIVKGNPCEERFKAMCWTFDDPLVDDVLNHWKPAEGARREGVKKFTLYKAAAGYAEQLGLPPREDQRSDASRRVMSEKLKSKYIENRR